MASEEEQEKETQILYRKVHRAEDLLYSYK